MRITTLRLFRARSFFLAGLNRMSQSRWVDRLFIFGVVALLLAAWQLKPFVQANQDLNECLQSEVISVTSMPPRCLDGVIKKHGDDKNVVMRVLALTTLSALAKSQNAGWWCSNTRLAFEKYDRRTRWSEWKQGLWGGDEQLIQNQLSKGRELCRAYPSGTASMRNPVGSLFVSP
jgi:hypothetical protein